MARLSNSGTGIDARLGFAAGDVLVDLRSGVVEALSTFRDDRFDLCLDFSLDLVVSGSLSLSLSRDFSLDLGVSESLSLSLSLIFEGMSKDEEACEKLKDALGEVSGEMEICQA